jgi:hypothetical protein
MAITHNYRAQLKTGSTLSHKIVELDDKPIVVHRIVVHRFTLGDVEDPDLYAAEPLWKWQNSEAGKWVTTHAHKTPEWHRSTDFQTWGYQYVVTAWLTESDCTFFRLKWSNNK